MSNPPRHTAETPARIPAVCALLVLALSSANSREYPVEKVIIDADGPRHAWGKAAGDLDGDGRVDLLVGGNTWPSLDFWDRIRMKLGLLDADEYRGELTWYRNPDWVPQVISYEFAIRTDVEIGDVDGDGVNDVVALTDDGVVGFRGPGWAAFRPDASAARQMLHDLELADFDGDGRLDIAVRNQSLFDQGEKGDRVHIIYQPAAGTWPTRELRVDHGEGMVVADMDGDGWMDIVVNGQWLRNPGSRAGEWSAHDYGGQWTWQDVSLDAVDVNGDGRRDILAAPSEMPGQRYRLSWFEAPETPAGRWVEHILEDDVEAVHHSIVGGDADGDGDIDIFAAEMNQGEDPDEVKVFLNLGEGLRFDRQVLDSDGSHNMRVVDTDGDGRDEVFGANWQFPEWGGTFPVTLWRLGVREESGKR